MKISEIGGEFALIERETKRFKNKEVIVSIGDDTAVLRGSKNKYILLTTDMLVEDDHFSLKWSNPEQIGRKAIEVNVSDIAAMGGLPKYVLVSLCLKKDTAVEFVDGLYKGIGAVCKKYKTKIIGGDMTHGSKMVINIAMTGEVEKERLCLRSQARVGDLICVTGDLGRSTAGLELLLAKRKGYTKAHIEPKARLKEAREASKYCNAMIDVSDGLAPDVTHICEESNVGAIICREDIPISRKTRKAAKQLGKDPYEFALRGGEDFELIFTISRKKLKKIKLRTPITVVGKVVPKGKGIHLQWDDKLTPLGMGYDHFR